MASDHPSSSVGPGGPGNPPAALSYRRSPCGQRILYRLATEVACKTWPDATEPWQICYEGVLPLAGRRYSRTREDGRDRRPECPRQARQRLGADDCGSQCEHHRRVAVSGHHDEPIWAWWGMMRSLPMTTLLSGVGDVASGGAQWIEEWQRDGIEQEPYAVARPSHHADSGWRKRTMPSNTNHGGCRSDSNKQCRNALGPSRAATKDHDYMNPPY